MGLPVTYVTWDLHRERRTDSPSTEHEEMFTAQGIRTKFLIARYCGEATDRQIEAMLSRYPKFAPAKVPRASSSRRSSDPNGERHPFGVSE